MTPSTKPNLDVASARKVARGQISVTGEIVAQRVAGLTTKFPSKRGAWVRAVEKEFRGAYRENLLEVVSEKRRVLAVYLAPLIEQYEGWLEIQTTVASFGAAMRHGRISVISEHAIVRLMQGLRDCSVFDALKQELSGSYLSSIVICIANTQNRPETICVPTRSGYFPAKWDHNHGEFVYTNWHPGRLLTDKERGILDKLRCEERVGLAAELGDCV